MNTQCTLSPQKIATPTVNVKTHTEKKGEGGHLQKCPHVRGWTGLRETGRKEKRGGRIKGEKGREKVERGRKEKGKKEERRKERRRKERRGGERRKGEGGRKEKGEGEGRKVPPCPPPQTWMGKEWQRNPIKYEYCSIINLKMFYR